MLCVIIIMMQCYVMRQDHAVLYETGSRSVIWDGIMQCHATGSCSVMCYVVVY